MEAEHRRSKKAAYRELLTAVTDILYRHDPVIGVPGLPDDEYQPEATTILPRLAGASSVDDVQQIVHEELVRWFDADLTPPEVELRPIAEEICEAWNRIGPLT